MNFWAISPSVKSVLSVVVAIAIILAMITVHEFGHYIMGKIFKFKINEFSIGFGPALFKRRRKNGELFAIRLIPLGGYCAFEGESSIEGELAQKSTDDSPFAEDAPPEEDRNERAEVAKNKPCLSFNEQAPWKRMLVLMAGAMMNFLLALLCILLCFSIFGQSSYFINSVDTESATTLQSEDVIISINGNVIYYSTDVPNSLNGKHHGEKVEVIVLRNNKYQSEWVTLSADCIYDGTNNASKAWHALGVGTREETQEDGVTRYYYDIGVLNVHHDFLRTIGHSFGYAGKMAITIFHVIGDLFSGQIGIESMGGPITTIKMTSEMVSQGWRDLLTIVGYIGVNLAVLNLLPLPALDGSRVLFCLVEWIRRKPIPRRVEAVIHGIGLLIIMGFAVLVDVLKLI